MTCGGYSRAIVEYARGGTPGEDLLRHLEQCRDCAETFAAQRQLGVGLRALAAEASAAAPSTALEARLLAAYRQAQRRPRRPSRAWYWYGAAAACVVLAAAGVAWRRVVTPPPPVEMPARAAVPAPPPPPALPPAPQPARHAAVRKPRRAPARPPEVATEFLPFPSAPALADTEPAQVLRVRVPRSLMMTVGLPWPGDRLWEPVNADVVFGQDGTARAIRFVK